MKNKLTSLIVALCVTLPAVATLTGCAGDRYNRSTGEYIDDKAVSVRVKGALGNSSEYKFGDVNVTSFRGTVQLSGFVNTTDQKSAAGRIAKTVEGVREIENNIIVKETGR